MAGVIPAPRSLEVRFEYWRAALRMIRDHPLDGMGLGGFAENYSYFKTALGTETREAHNDYIHLWAELGVLGPLVYLALWGLLLHAGGRRLHGDAAAGAPVEETGGGPATEKGGRAPALEHLAIAGGIVGFVLMFVAFRVFNSPDIVRLLAGTVDLETIGSTLHTLALPGIFVCVVVGLRAPTVSGDSQPVPRQQETSVASVPGVDLVTWTHSVRAAAGAVLVHQLVDFDFKAQAVMGALFLLGGMMFALHEAPGDSQPAPPPQETGAGSPTALGRASRYLLPALAVVLFFGAAWIPMFSGVARGGAEALEEEARSLLRAKPPDGRDLAKDKKYRELRREIAELRLKAARAAPFDGSAWLDVAVAYEGMQRAHRSTSVHQEILACLDEGERLRPVSPAPKLMRGDYLFVKAIRERRRNQPPSVLFLVAAKAYAAGAARYPLAPGPKVLAGDALLMGGQVEAAAAEYLKAFQTDIA
ncbi:MAG: O-antigen ligase family protein, partial [Planctomycetota bacterium]|nr:O-antigen ligase family protein [Planctomycetota bacterium]